MKGYKVFNSDWTCKGFQYEIGKEYVHKGSIKICNRGFHFCEKLIDCFIWYKFDPNNKVAEVEAFGTIEKEEEKSVTDKIRIVKELSWYEVLDLVNIGINNTGKSNSGHYNSGDNNSGNYNSGDNNSGNYNSGHYNSGHYNSGNYNSGHYNSGNYNSGHYNSGNYNSGDNNSGNYNSGDFNDRSDLPIYVFGKLIQRKNWNNAKKPNFIYNIQLTEWKNDKLIKYEYKEAWKTAFDKADSSEMKLLINLPNFNYQIFKNITGITKEMIQNKLKEEER